MPTADAKRTVDAVFFIPFAERDLDAVVDAIDSIDGYVAEPHHIYAVDDCSASHRDEDLHRLRPHVTVLRNPRSRGPRAGLHRTMVDACRRALDDFEFEILIKMDSDALMTGPGLVAAAIRYFAAHPGAGVLGSYRVRADGQRRTWTTWKLALWYESTPLRRLLGQRVRWRRELQHARAYGYRGGEHVLGGAYIVSEACVRAVTALDDLEADDEAALAGSRIGEDVIWSLLSRTAGFEIHDFGMPDQLMALALDRIPIPKEEVIRLKKAIVHSVRRGFHGETESAVRAFFRAQRSATAQQGAATGEHHPHGA
jgi:hypothetical protein